MKFPKLHSARFLLALLLLVSLPAVSQVSVTDEQCSNAMNTQAEPLVKPKEPQTKPYQPQTQPEKEPEKPVRRAPVPIPDRPVNPTYDPKDIIPIELYVKDPLAKPIYASLPDTLKSAMLTAVEAEKARLIDQLKNLGVENPENAKALITQITQDLAVIQALEMGNEPTIEQGIHSYLVDEFGEAAIEGLEFRIDQTLPDRPPSPVAEAPKPPRTEWNPVRWLKGLFTPGRVAKPAANDAAFNPELKAFYEYRREVYNLIAQGLGWQAMARYPQQSIDLLLVQPALPGLYQRFYLSFRLMNHLALAGVKTPTELNTPELRESTSVGREIVEVNGKTVSDPDTGSRYIEIERIRGIAVGKNGLALAHEMMKAAFQMATALEATQRMVLTGPERHTLDLATNSNSAEVRQAIYGPVVAERILGNLRLCLGKGPAFYLAVEQIFAMNSPSAFHEIISLASIAQLDQYPEELRKLQSLLQQWVAQ